MEKRFLIQNLKDQEYINFLNFCLIHFDVFYLYRRSDLKPFSKKGLRVMDQLSSFLLSSEIGCEYLSGEKMYSNEIYLNIYKYRCCPESIDCLSQVRNSLFSWQLGNSPEDLSFESLKRKDKFCSVAHEHFGFFEGDDEFITQLEKAFHGSLLTEEEFNKLDKYSNEDWIVDENGNDIYVGEEDDSSD